jgi:hypothetical protein
MAQWPGDVTNHSHFRIALVMRRHIVLKREQKRVYSCRCPL